MVSVVSPDSSALQVHKTVSSALSHKQCPFDPMLETLNYNRDPSLPPAFQVPTTHSFSGRTVSAETGLQQTAATAGTVGAWAILVALVSV